jgi:hypothetical protein
MSNLGARNSRWKESKYIGFPASEPSLIAENGMPGAACLKRPQQFLATGFAPDATAL